MITSVRRIARRLSSQILLFQLLILVGTLGVGFALALEHARGRVDDQYEQRALGVARAVSAIPEIADAVARGDRSGIVQRRGEAVRRAARVDFVVVADMRGIRYSHPNPARIGERVSTDPSDALRGRTVLAVEEGTLGRSARAKIPLRARDGRIVGVVSVGILEGALHEEEDGLLVAMVLHLVIALAIGLAASLLLARRLKRQTFGLELDQLASLVQEREAMLHGIREGVVIVGPDGRLLLVNDHARRLVYLPPDAVGRGVDDVTATGRLADLLAGRTAGEDQLLVHGDRLIVANRMSVQPDGRARLEGELVDVREGLTILGNLIDNALDAAPAGERRPPLVRVFVADEMGALLVRVRDSGPGVPFAARARVFQPGYTTKEGGGRGVRLSLIRQLAGGALFTAWLPDAVKSANAVAP